MTPHPHVRESSLPLLWNEEFVFHQGDSYFKSLLIDIGQARQSVDFETYIYANDSWGRELAQALKEAQLRGVSVRIIIDAFGSPTWALNFNDLLRSSGVKTKIYHPLWFLLQINRRNHRKSCVIDRRIAYVGSMNVSTCHSQVISGEHAWRDTVVRVSGPVVRIISRSFEYIWSGKRKHLAIYKTSKSLVRINNTLRLRQYFYKDLLNRIESARSRIWITTPYFIPRPSLLRALRRAAQRGVDTRVLLPRKSDLFFMRWAMPTYYTLLMEGGVRIFEYLPRVLHAKITMIDDWATIGSSNLNHRSLIHDLEMDVVLTHLNSIESLATQYSVDLSNSEEITLNTLKQEPWYQQFLVNMAARLILLFRYWM